MPVMVLIREMASAPPASAALAISAMLVTLGVSFMMTGWAATRRILSVIRKRASGSCPKAMAPSFTLGQETLISSRSTASPASRSTTARYSSSVLPQTLTMTLVSNCFRNSRSRFTKTSTPGFCSPMALSMPPYTSVTLGTGLPSQGVLATPLVVTAPSLFRSTNSLYSIPDPKVPEAVVTGFLKVTPAILTDKSGFGICFPPAG